MTADAMSGGAETVELSVVVPVFNEEEGVVESLGSLHAALSDLPTPIAFEILVVDDGSTDGTRALLDAVEGIRILENPRNLGYGAAVKRGVRDARGPWILITDGDASYPASNLPRLLDPLELDGPTSGSLDMVVGARSLRSIRNPALWNAAKALFQNMLARLLGAEVPDINSGMRLFRRDVALRYESFLSDAFSYSSGLTVSFLRGKRGVLFVPIEYVERKGTSKVRPLSFSVAFLRSIIGGWRAGGGDRGRS